MDLKRDRMTPERQPQVNNVNKSNKVIGRLSSSDHQEGGSSRKAGGGVTYRYTKKVRVPVV